MSSLSGLEFRGGFRQEHQTPHQQVVRQHALMRILSFLNLTIHDVCNCPIARGKVNGYFKLTKEIDRNRQVIALENQWNGPHSYAK